MCIIIGAQLGGHPSELKCCAIVCFDMDSNETYSWVFKKIKYRPWSSLTYKRSDGTSRDQPTKCLLHVDQIGTCALTKHGRRDETCSLCL